MEPQRVNLPAQNTGVHGINLKQANTHPAQAKQQGASFNESFNEALIRAAGIAEENTDVSGLKFSKHAATRLNSREVDLTPEQLRRVEEGIRAALVKGVSDSLVLVDEYALVVNTRSRTVITAMNSNQRNDGVFTNINGAVIV